MILLELVVLFLSKLFDKSEFLSQNDLMIDTASKIRLRIINSILSEHSAVLKHIKGKGSLIFTIEF